MRSIGSLPVNSEGVGQRGRGEGNGGKKDREGMRGGEED